MTKWIRKSRFSPYLTKMLIDFPQATWAFKSGLTAQILSQSLLEDADNTEIIVQLKKRALERI